ncbi:MAG: DUF6597 domain-containing transcriptional factor [Cyanophyceae cyanobacterium]
MYQIKRPAAALHPYISCYWSLHTTSHCLQENIWLDGQADLIINMNQPYYRGNFLAPRRSEIAKSNLDAQRTYSVSIQQRGTFTFLVSAFFRAV